LVIALFIYGALVGEGWAAKVSIGGTHSRSEIQATCGAVGGDFFSIEGGNYGCTKECAGGTDTCAVECTNNGKCTGSCPRCGRVASPNRTPLPRLAWRGCGYAGAEKLSQARKAILSCSSGALLARRRCHRASLSRFPAGA